MSKKQKTYIFALPVLAASMIPVFRILSGIFIYPAAWYIGLFSYWMLWCGALSFFLIGKDGIINLLKFKKPDAQTLGLVLLPLILTLTFKVATGTEYQKANMLAVVIFFSSTFGNGFFEELLWRGVSLKLFPENILWRVFWPTLWFALWHYAPGSISPSGNVWALITGAAFLGLYSSFIAKRTNTIFWSVLMHIFGGLILVG